MPESGLDPRTRQGSLLILSAFLLVIGVAMAAFTTDLGFITMSRDRVKSAVDAAALAAVGEMWKGQAAVQSTIHDLLAVNGFDTATNPDLDLTIKYGTWDAATHTFTPLAEFEKADTVRVLLVDNDVTAFFGDIFQQRAYTVSGEAIASGGDSSVLRQFYRKTGNDNVGPKLVR